MIKNQNLDDKKSAMLIQKNQSNRAEKKHILMSLFHTLVVQKFQLSMPEF